MGPSSDDGCCFVFIVIEFRMGHLLSFTQICTGQRKVKLKSSRGLQLTILKGEKEESDIRKRQEQT